MPEWVVIYRAVADFSELTDKAAESELSLEALKRKEQEMNDASVRGSTSNAQARERATTKIREETLAIWAQVAAQEQLNRVQSGGNTGQSDQQRIQWLDREKQAQDQLNRSRQRGFQTPQQDFSFRQQEIAQWQQYARASQGGAPTFASYLQDMDRERQAWDRQTQSLRSRSLALGSASEQARGYVNAVQGTSKSSVQLGGVDSAASDLTGLQSQLTAVGGTTATPDIEVQGSRQALTEIAAVDAGMTRLDKKTATPHVETSGIDRAQKAFKQLSLPGLLPTAVLLSPTLIPIAGALATAIGAVTASLGGAAIGALGFSAVAKSVLTSAGSDAQNLAKLQLKATTDTTLAQKAATKQQLDALEKGWTSSYKTVVTDMGKIQDKWKATSREIASPVLAPWLDAVYKGLNLIKPLLQPVADLFESWGKSIDQYFGSKKGSEELHRIATELGNFSADQLSAIGVFFTDSVKAIANLGRLLAQHNVDFGAFGTYLDQWGGSFLRWSQSKAARKDVNDFLKWIHENGPVVRDFIKEIGTFLKDFSPGLSDVGALELRVITDFLKFIDGLPPGLAKPLVEVAGALLLLSKTGVIKAGLSLLAPGDTAIGALVKLITKKLGIKAAVTPVLAEGAESAAAGAGGAAAAGAEGGIISKILGKGVKFAVRGGIIVAAMDILLNVIPSGGTPSARDRAPAGLPQSFETPFGMPGPKDPKSANNWLTSWAPYERLITQTIPGWWSKTGKFIQNQWNTIWSNTITGAVNDGKTLASTVQRTWSGVENGAKTWGKNIGSTVSGTWSGIENGAKTWGRNIGSNVSGTWSNLEGGARTWGKNIGSNVSSTYDTLLGGAKTWGSNIGSTFRSAWGGVLGGAKQWGSNIASSFSSTKNWIQNNFLNPVSNWFTQSLPHAFSVSVSSIGSIWSTIEGKIRGPVVSVMNNSIGRLDSIINSVAGWVGLHPNLPTKFARGGRAPGGRINGYAPNTDSELAAVSPGEYILTPEAASGIGYARLDAINQSFSGRTPARYSDGGGVPAYANGGSPGGRAFWAAGPQPQNQQTPSFLKGLGSSVGNFLGDLFHGAGDTAKILVDLATGNTKAAANAMSDMIPHGAGGAGAGGMADMLLSIPNKLLSLAIDHLVHPVEDFAKKNMGSGNSIVQYAMSFLGKIPYVWGGTSVPGGADCSGFTQAVYGHFGIPAPRTSEAQGAWVNKGSPQPGGLAFYHSPPGGPDPGHVAIVKDTKTAISQGGGMGPKLMGLNDMPLLWTGTPPGGFPAGLNGLGNTGGVMSPAQIASLWVQQGGPSYAASNMARIAFAESGDNPSIVQKGQPPGLTGYGLYQITPTSGIWQNGRFGNLLNAANNTRAAVSLFFGSGYAPWTSDPVGAGLVGGNPFGISGRRASGGRFALGGAVGQAAPYPVPDRYPDLSFAAGGMSEGQMRAALAKAQYGERADYYGLTHSVSQDLQHAKRGSYTASHRRSIQSKLNQIVKQQAAEIKAYGALGGSGLTTARLRTLSSAAKAELGTAKNTMLTHQHPGYARGLQGYLGQLQSLGGQPAPDLQDVRDYPLSADWKSASNALMSAYRTEETGFWAFMGKSLPAKASSREKSNFAAWKNALQKQQHKVFGVGSKPPGDFGGVQAKFGDPLKITAAEWNKFGLDLLYFDREEAGTGIKGGVNPPGTPANSGFPAWHYLNADWTKLRNNLKNVELQESKALAVWKNLYAPGHKYSPVPGPRGVSGVKLAAPREYSAADILSMLAPGPAAPTFAAGGMMGSFSMFDRALGRLQSEPPRGMSGAAQAAGKTFNVGDITINNPIREQAGGSLTRSVNRLALLAGR